MRPRLRARALGLMVALAGNLSILAAPLAHGRAHEDLARHSHPAHGEHEHASVDAAAFELDDADPDRDHDHPDLAGTPTPKLTLLPVLVAVGPLIEPTEFLNEQTPPPHEELARARGRPSLTAPPQLRAPPTA
jgi:hypothetical protein